MKRVLFFDDTPAFGGHQLTAIAAARHLARASVEVVAAFRADNARMHAAWRDCGADVRLVPLALSNSRWQPLLAPFGLGGGAVRALLRDAKPDVVVAVQGTIVQSNRAVEQARRLRIPVVSFVPMGVHFAPGQWLFRLISRVLERYHYRRPDAFITTSRHARQELRQGGARAPIEVVYGSVDPSRFPLQPREPRSRYTLALLGRVSIGTKGHDVALRALARIPDAQLLIAGDGPDDRRVDALVAELGLQERVSRLPWQQEMSRVYASVDTVILPSRFEGLPMVALEAMLSGLPVVAADMGAMREVLPAEWIFPVGDAAGLAAAVGRVRSSDLREPLAANRERVLREFTEERFGESFRAALEGLSEQIRARRSR